MQTRMPMTPKTNIGRFLRRRRSRFTRNCLLGAAVFVLIGVQANAFTAYVSNEKSNTISVIDTDKFTVLKTIKVGQRPRGIELTKDGKFVLVAVGDDDTIQVIDVRTHEIVATLPSGPVSRAVHAGSHWQDTLCRQRKRQHGHDNRLGTARSSRGGTGRGRAGRHGPQSGR